MLYGNEPLFHAIVAAHRDPDPRMARRYSPFSPTPRPRHVAALLPLMEGRRPARRSVSALGPLGGPGGPHLSRPAGLTAAFGAVLRVARRALPAARARQTTPCCVPACR